MVFICKEMVKAVTINGVTFNPKWIENSLYRAIRTNELELDREQFDKLKDINVFQTEKDDANVWVYTEAECVGAICRLKLKA